MSDIYRKQNNILKHFIPCRATMPTNNVQPLKNDFTMSDEMTPPETNAPDMMPGLRDFHIGSGSEPRNKRGGAND